MKIAVVGGGASGIMAAINAAKGGATVTLFEATSRIGNKILLTGNGKCNFSNLYPDETSYYCNDKTFIEKTFDKFPAAACKLFFEDLGMLVKDKNGYLYPLGEQASIVLDILRLALKRYSVCIKTDMKIIRVQKQRKDFILITENGEEYTFDKVIVSTGGRSYPKTGSDGSGYKLAKKMGHHIFPTVPALVQLVGCDDYYKWIAGVRSDGVATLYVDETEVRFERGEIQFTDYGISGIPVFQLSRLAAYGLLDKKNVKIVVDVMPDFDIEQLKEMLKKRAGIHKTSTLEEFMCGLSNKKLCLWAIKKAGFKGYEKIDEISYKQVFELVLQLKNMVFHITDTKGYDTAQVTAGGVLTEELDENMQSKLVDGLYFVGEMVDVDGVCGGFNLQWAFASGYVAGCDCIIKKETMK